MFIALGIYLQHQAERRKDKLGHTLATVVGQHDGVSDSEKVLLVEVRYQADTLTVPIPVKDKQSNIQTGESVPVRYITHGRSIQEVYLEENGDSQVTAYEALSLGSFALAVVGYAMAVIPYIM